MADDQSIETSTGPQGEEPSWPLLFLLAFQHVIVLFCGIILVPVILIKMYDFPPVEGYRLIFVTTVFSVLATVFQVMRYKNFGLGRPMFMGTSGPFLSCAHMAITLGGAGLLSNLVFMSAPFQFLFAYCLRFMRHILTPTVGGVVIMLAVAGLLKDSTIAWCGNPEITGGEAYADILIGLVTVAGMVLSEWMLGKRFRHWSLALGLFLGFSVALVLGHVDLSPMGRVPYVGIPKKLYAGFVFQSDFQHWVLYFTFVVAVFVSSIKYSGDVMALQRVEEPNNRKMDYDGIQGGLYASATSATITGLAGGLPSTSHSPNIPIMELTGVCNKKVVLLSSCILLFLAFSPKAAMALMCIPAPVVGAVGIVLVGHLFSTGLRLVADGDLCFKNAFIAGISICIGLVMESDLFFPNAFPEYLVPLTTNGFAIGGIIAVLLTLLSRFQEDSGTVIFLDPDLQQLEELHEGVQEISQDYGLDRNSKLRLALACEEVFAHMANELEDQPNKGKVLFRLIDNNGTVNVEVQGGQRVRDVDEPMPVPEKKSLMVLDEHSLKDLGLVLFGRLATNINHFHIDNYTYISFSVEKES